MSEPGSDYRMYLTEKFSGLTTSMNAQFKTFHDRQDDLEKSIKELKTKLDDTYVQVKLTNHRVTHLEEFHEDDFIDLEGKVDRIDKELIEYRMAKKYPRVMIAILAVFLGGFLLSVFGTVKTITFSKKQDLIISEIDKVVEDINNEKNLEISF